ncbi:MAG TPA: hypothetical protein VJ021_02385 [Thermoplasmata archaeon]|nr:hypothetical protein [Thermoplasmata archaeon]
MAQPGGSGFDPRTSIVVIAVAIVLAALLQLVVFDQFAEERLAILAVEIVLFVALLWSYSGGYQRAAVRYDDWKLRRHIRKHPEMVSALEGLINQIEDTFGPQRDGFRNATMSVLNDWWRVYSETLNTDKPSAFSKGDFDSYQAAYRATGFWQTHLQDWPAVRSTANHLLQTTARVDGLSYGFAAYLLRSYVASSIVYIQDFTLNAQQMNVGKIAQIKLNDWATYAKKVNELVSAARAIDILGPTNIGYDLGLKFEPVVEQLAIMTVYSGAVVLNESLKAGAQASPTAPKNPHPPPSPASSETSPDQ